MKEAPFLEPANTILLPTVLGASKYNLATNVHKIRSMDHLATNSIFGTSLVYAFVTMSTALTGAASGTRFMKVAGQLPALQAVYGVTTLSLVGHKPGQMLYCMYEAEGACSAFRMNYGRGVLYYLGFDWYNSPWQADTSRWDMVLGASVLPETVP
jgi:hypothetical protein